MPELYKILGWRIYFWSGDFGEPVHVHVGKGKPKESDTKIWVGEKIKLVHNKSRVPDTELFKIIRFIAQNKERIIRAWNEHFGID